ncbi:MAG: hypothetical protein R3B46_12065 [Phycisphaerales bacterium]
MRLGAVDWLTLVVYLGVVVTLGVIASSRGKGKKDWFFLGGRSMPGWAVALSFVGTAVSVATVTGVPESAYNGDLTYFAVLIAQLIAAVVVAFWFLPVFYRAGVASIYDALEDRYGVGARRGAGWLFLAGRVLASGARLYIAAIPVALMLFPARSGGGIDAVWLCAAVVIIAVVATAYTLAGGIAAVIWTDVAQVVVLLGAALLAMWLILDDLGIGVIGAYEAVREIDAGKLRLLDVSAGMRSDFSLLSVLTAMALFHIAAFGTDQDLVQRLLTCKDSKRAARSVIGSIAVMGLVIGVFLCVGLLLFLYYRPDAPGASVHVPPSGDKAFAWFVLHELPVGVRGLVFAGIVAAAMSSLDSALTAMASVGRRGSAEGARVRVVAWSVALTVCAILFVWASRNDGRGLIPFALSVMTYPYAGLLGVFLAFVFTRRGNGRSAVAAMVVGPLVVIVLEFVVPRVAGRDAWLITQPSAYPWRMAWGACAALVVCLCGRARQASALPSTSA